LQFGMFCELQMPRPWREGQELRLFLNALEWVEIGDRIGIDCVWAQEHHFLEEYSHSSAPEVFLAACSQRSKRMRLGHGITLMPPNFNHPVRVAERIATLDLVSQGRVEWGTGEASSRLELEGFGLNYLEKRAMWAEAVRETAKMMCSTPYPGYSGRYLVVPPRNVVPKPVQHPHPPLWVACSNRDTLRLAARLGIGALTFAFMDAGEARFWVEEYYDVFRRECTPIGQAVNPKVAMLDGLFCHRDRDTAIDRGLEGQRFFAWALAHYYRVGRHRPGTTNLWEQFKASPPFPMAGVRAVGTPDDVRAHLEELESAGVDQLILLQQAGAYEHDHICESLELFGSAVLGEFKERDEKNQAKRAEELAPYIERALERRPKVSQHAEVPVVESYGIEWARGGAANEQLGAKRALDSNAVWKLHVGGAPSVRLDGDMAK
jgi:alkanesulfonate monooxygenase SsuD/methylene tetrahydromethanopterin reductase-like flavin-dependent oxidoreductase (luciferase family)